ncbi:hypothetical protein [Spartinivicinus poritis]|uniref:Ricin B lectin domain-containing protein n=1 Tax=Spartinivicinus poritis TaxID=2994640 RepID=A0ABT5U334_9GAMM|nr:hypothetical protein [Spartinivicinus sp. A2-2]MDE1460775.1 hypothetical protein [Spartinivicinus sp. A2-2]
MNLKRLTTISTFVAILVAPSAYSELYQIKSKHRNLCLEYRGSGSGVIGKNTCSFNSISNFTWDIQPTGDVTPDNKEVVNIYSSVNYGCLVDAESSKYAPLEINCPHTVPKYQWVLREHSQHNGRQMYVIQSMAGQCLNIGRNSGKIYALNCHGRFDQLWYLEKM